MQVFTSFVFALVAIFFSLASGTTVPTCAVSCLADAVAADTTCTSATDVGCLCEADNVSALTTGSTKCVVEACGITLALQAVAAASETCAAYSSTATATGTAAAAKATSASDTTTLGTEGVSSSTTAAAAAASASSSSAAGDGTAAVVSGGTSTSTWASGRISLGLSGAFVLAVLIAV